MPDLCSWLVLFVRKLFGKIIHNLKKEKNRRDMKEEHARVIDPSMHVYSEESLREDAIKKEHIQEAAWRPMLDQQTQQFREYMASTHDGQSATKDYYGGYSDPTYDLPSSTPAYLLHAKLSSEHRKFFEEKSFSDSSSALANVSYDPSTRTYPNLQGISDNYSSVQTHQQRPINISRQTNAKNGPKSSPSLDTKSFVKTEAKLENKPISDMKFTDKESMNPDKKPPYSYVALINMALKCSDTGKLRLNDIYTWIAEKFPYFKRLSTENQTGWKNSIRHNLSLNECFIKFPGDGNQGGGKGHFWMMDESFGEMFENGNYKRRRKPKKTNVPYITHYGHYSRLPTSLSKVEHPWQMSYESMVPAGSQYNSSSYAQPQPHFPPHYPNYSYSPHYSQVTQFQNGIPLGGNYPSSLGNSLGGSSAFASYPYQNAGTGLGSSSLTPGLSSLALNSGTSGSLTTDSSTSYVPNSSISGTVSEPTYYNVGALTVLNSGVSPRIDSGISSHPGSPGMNSPYGTNDSNTYSHSPQMQEK